MRVVGAVGASALLVAIILATSAPASCADAHPLAPSSPTAPPVVGSEGGGSFEGHLGYGDNEEREPGRPRGKKADSDSADRPRPKEPKPERDPNCDLGPGNPIPTARNCPREPVQPETEPEPEELDDATAESYARQLVVRLQLPDPTPQFGPDPSVNEWNMAAVGYPLWLWTEGPRTVTSTETAYGLTFTLQAHYRSTTFELGDGHTRQCTDTTPYRRSVKPGTPSPTCGYTYLNPAPGDGAYTVTATTHWDVDWSVAGFSGTLPGTHTASSSLPVGELQAIVVK